MRITCLVGGLANSQAARRGDVADFDEQTLHAGPVFRQFRQSRADQVREIAKRSGNGNRLIAAAAALDSADVEWSWRRTAKEGPPAACAIRCVARSHASACVRVAEYERAVAGGVSRRGDWEGEREA